LAESSFPRNGNFIEFGTPNCIELSNAMLLERKFDWSEILVELCISSFQIIQINRETRALNYEVHAESGLHLTSLKLRVLKFRL
jgi:hypothetical protein